MNLLMAKIVSFSQPTDSSLKIISQELFKVKEKKKFAYMPANGINNKSKKYAPFWEGYVKDNSNYSFVKIDNSKVGKGVELEKDKILNADILLISGGNTFTLLRNIRRNGMDDTIKDFAKRNSSILVGFSAGALVLTPNIEIVVHKQTDKNIVGINDFTALGLVSFEVSPHYSLKRKSRIDDYKQKSKNEVKVITDDDVIVV